MLQLEPEQIERLDREAVRTGVSRSQLVREAVAAALRPDLDLDLEARYRRAYAPQPDVDEWGDIDAWHAAAGRDRAGRDSDEW